MSKRVDSVYVGGRTRTWMKSKCGQRQEFVVGGFTVPKKSRSGFGALLLGYYNARNQLVYCGRVGTGFDESTLHDLHERLRRIETSANPFDRPPTRTESSQASWVKPRLVAEVQFAQWTATDRLRQAVFVGLREDKAAKLVRRDSSGKRVKSSS